MTGVKKSSIRQIILLAMCCTFSLGACKSNTQEKTPNTTAQETPKNNSNRQTATRSSEPSPKPDEENHSLEENISTSSNNEATPPSPSSIPSYEPIDLEKERDSLQSSVTDSEVSPEPTATASPQEENTESTEGNGDDNKRIAI